MSFGPVDAGVRYALPVDERFTVAESLRSRHEIAFDHDAHDVAVSVCDLLRYRAAYGALVAMIFATVRMAAVDHDARFHTYLFHLPGSGGNRSCIVIRDLPAAAQDDVAVRIAGGKKDGRLSRLRGSEEGMWL